MLPLKYAPHWRVASIALMVAVMLATLTPAVWFWPDRAQFVNWVGGVDKWAHLLTFLVLTAWFCGLYRRQYYWRIALGLFVFGSLIELAQRWVGYRSGDFLDLLADVIGIIAGLGVAMAGVGGWSQWVESWIVKRKN
ncbi:MAG: VanZ family protein [Woeseiaceae bacterium]|nr:VanZ family protein [Woeseiaceae bacterium]